MPKKFKKPLLFLFCTVLYMLFLINCSAKPEPADLVLMNGKIVTVDDNNPEAEAIAINGDTITAVGANKKIEKYIGDATEVIDLEGKLAVPGLIDSHVHFTGIGEARLGLDLMHVKNWDEVVVMVKEAVEKAKPGEWITGRGWHQEKWDKAPEPNVSGLPYHYELSKVSPDNPVSLSHASGHSSIANAKAMKQAGITRNTPDPEGGEIVKDARGNLLGVFRETAQGLLRAAYYEHIGNRTEEEIEAEDIKVFELAVEECLSKGLTSVHDAGVSFDTIDFFKRMADEGKLGIRLYVMIRESNGKLEELLPEYKIIGYADNHLTARSIKRSIDGALGPHGAWLLEPYDSLPESTGLNTYPVQDLKVTSGLAIAHGFQLNVHAIGDRGNRESLDVFESIFQAQPGKTDLRWRIEHSQHLHPADIPRFGELGVIASMQGIHCTSDGPWVIKRLGNKRAEEGAYMWRELMKTGAVICNGTDAPVEDVDPLPSFYASVTRRMKDGNVFFGGQKMSRMEALKSYTINGAFAAFEENIKGSLIPGKLADITVLSRDIMTVPDDVILETEVLYTIVGGKVLYKK